MQAYSFVTRKPGRPRAPVKYNLGSRLCQEQLATFFSPSLLSFFLSFLFVSFFNVLLFLHLGVTEKRHLKAEGTRKELSAKRRTRNKRGERFELNGPKLSAEFGNWTINILFSRSFTCNHLVLFFNWFWVWKQAEQSIW